MNTSSTISCFSFCFRLLLFFDLIVNPALAQNIQWQILSPEANAVVGNENLFVSASLSNFEPSADAVILLDNTLLPGSIKVSGNRISFVYFGTLRNGSHTLTIKTPVKQLKRTETTTWTFYVNKKEDAKVEKVIKPKDRVSLSGSLLAENRSTWLSGSGQDLRQEPGYTRSVSLTMTARYKHAEVPVRIYATSDNRFTQQSNNFFQVGYHNRWLELDVGDMNPNYDKLMLTGVRVRGAQLKFKIGKSSVKVIYGDMVRQPLEGLLERYTPGAGYLPSTFINDTQYVVPGVYKRWMAAARTELVSKKERFKIGFTALKVKDKLSSIQYGLQPKDNLSGGMDVTLRLFKRAVMLHSSVASSVLTNDISYGVVDRDQLLKSFHVSVSFDPAKYKDYIILNSTTVPADYNAIKDAIASYSQLTYSNRYQSLNVEYRSIGALYNSLGNPFLRNNYKGLSVGERFNFFRRKVNFSINYQDYNNNTNQSLLSSIHTNLFNSSVVLTVADKWPSVVLNYMLQNRNSQDDFKSLYAIKDKLKNYMININYRKSFWNIEHNFRASFNLNNRLDILKPNNEINYYNYSVGFNEVIQKRFTVNAEFGKTLVKDATKEKITDINTYALFAEWQIITSRLNSSVGFSNNKVIQTFFTPDSYRLSAIVRVGYKFYKSMGLDLEAGYDPYKEKINTLNNYDEKYIYLRYLYDFNFR